MNWTLAISTYNRPDILCRCVEMALRQTRMPAEIVVVDASLNWTDSRARITGIVAPTGVRLNYESAKSRSSSLQRNQALDRARSDIVFLIDDDSFMHETCAAEIMRVYEEDTQGRIGAVGARGVAENPAHHVAPNLERKITGHGVRILLGDASFIQRVSQFFYRHVLLMSFEGSFISYDGDGTQRSIPETDTYVSTNNIVGYALTVRRAATNEVRFDEHLLHYAALEDADFCFRLRRSWDLVIAKKAKLHHFQTGQARLPREQVIILQLLNMAYFLRRHSSASDQRKRDYRVLLVRRLLAEVIKDGMSRRLSFPQVRGVVFAMRNHGAVFRMPITSLASEYAALQEYILHKRSPGA